ncbi:sensor histidine kinase [Candidatus Latescibacterota bacterium]
MTSFIFSSTIVFEYVIILTIIFLGLLVAENFGIIPHLTYDIYFGFTHRQIDAIKAFGLVSTLIISVYLITSIKSRIEEKGKNIEIELDHYKSLDQIKTNFILQVTHELRGPIAALMGFHEMIMKGITGEINKETEDVLYKANRRTGNLLHIIDEMIDYAYLKSEEDIHYENIRIHLKSIIDYNLDLIMTLAKNKKINIISNCSKNLMVHANKDFLNIVFNNLLNNSLKYSPKGTTVTVNASIDKDKIHLLIKDEGMGINPSEMNNIFEEFYRSRKAREIERDGTGLGLPIVKRAVERMNGRISVYSELGKGTTFHIYLPQYIKRKELENK